MKFVLIMIIVAGVSLHTMAGCENSRLVIHTNSAKPIKVYVDGMTGRNRPAEYVTVNGLTPGRHELKVVAVFTDYYGYTKRRVIYTGIINVRPSMYMDAWVEEGKGVSIHETKEPCNEQYGQSSQATNSRNGETNYGNNSQGYNNSPSYAAPQNNGSQTNNNNNYTPAGSGNDQRPAASGNLPAHISDDDFEQLKNTIVSTTYETRKMDILKAQMGNNLFATSQVGMLMNLFSFESNKLDVAKLLYDSTVDKQNYGRLASNFNFDARKEDFKKFMAGK